MQRLMMVWRCARITAMAFAALAYAPNQVAALDLFATSFFSPAEGDPDPALTGVLKIDLNTGVAATIIPESPAGLLMPTDVVLNESTNTLYVSSQTGVIWHYDAVTGQPLPSLVGGASLGTFAQLPTAGFGDGVNSLLLSNSGDLLAATAFGAITPYDIGTGAQGADLASGLNFPSGLSETPGGTLIVSTGDPFGGPGALVSIDEGVVTTIVPPGAAVGLLGASNPTVVLPAGDYSGGGDVTQLDYTIWENTYGLSGATAADGNGDGLVDAADYTIWRDTLGDEAQIVVADLNANQLVQYDLDGANGSQLAVIPPEIPDPLPPTANPASPSNSPSEVLVTDQGTLLVSTLGLTRRPDNRGALLEFDRNGTLLRTIASDLPPLSGVAFAPSIAVVSVPEPGAAILLILTCTLLLTKGKEPR